MKRSHDAQADLLEADVQHRRFTVSPEVASFWYFMDMAAPLSLRDAPASNFILKAPTSGRLNPLQALLTRVPRRDPLGSIKFCRRKWISDTPPTPTPPLSYTRTHARVRTGRATAHRFLRIILRVILTPFESLIFTCLS